MCNCGTSPERMFAHCFQFDKSLADTMVKQVKTKTNLKVCIRPRLQQNILGRLTALPRTSGPLAHLPLMRRRLDVHRQGRDVQDGIQRDCVDAEGEDCSMQERRRHRAGQEVVDSSITSALPAQRSRGS